MVPWYNASIDVRGIPVTRYVASWYIAGGKANHRKVERWLRSLIINGEPLNDDEVYLLRDCITTGKLELQDSAKDYI